LNIAVWVERWEGYPRMLPDLAFAVRRHFCEADIMASQERAGRERWPSRGAWPSGQSSKPSPTAKRPRRCSKRKANWYSTSSLASKSSI